MFARWPGELSQPVMIARGDPSAPVPRGDVLTDLVGGLIGQITRLIDLARKRSSAWGVAEFVAADIGDELASRRSGELCTHRKWRESVACTSPVHEASHRLELAGRRGGHRVVAFADACWSQQTLGADERRCRRWRKVNERLAGAFQHVGADTEPEEREQSE